MKQSLDWFPDLQVYGTITRGQHQMGQWDPGHGSSETTWSRQAESAYAAYGRHVCDSLHSASL